MSESKKTKCVGQSRPGEINGMFGSERFGEKNPFFGKKHSEETRKKISESKRNSKTTPRRSSHPEWQGDFPSYQAVHKWLKKHFGIASHCDDCWLVRAPYGKKQWFEWSNTDGRYKRERASWNQLCVPCHRVKDKNPVALGLLGRGIFEYKLT